MFVGFVTQLRSPPNVCVWSVDRRCVHTQSSLSVFTMLSTTVQVVFTALLCSFSAVKLTFYLHWVFMDLTCVHNTVQFEHYLYRRTDWSIPWWGEDR